MADFWIKIEKSTPDKPEIFEIAATLNIDPDAVLGKLVRVWSWLDSNSENGHIKSVTPILIDRLTTCPGFADAMSEAGWLTSDLIPNFDRHLGESAKKRAKDTERKRKLRDKSSECPAESGTESGLDKSRVDKDKILYSEDDKRLAEYIYTGILTVASKTKQPNMDKWSDTVRLMREQDNLTHKEIAQVFKWAINDDFWKTNIQSPIKLRKQFASLHSKMVNPNENPKGFTTANEKRSELASHTYDYEKAIDF